MGGAKSGTTCDIGFTVANIGAFGGASEDIFSGVVSICSINFDVFLFSCGRGVAIVGLSSSTGVFSTA